VDLFKARLSAAEIGEICRRLGRSPRELLRTRDPAYEALGLASGSHSDAEILALMAENPGLIQRPIVARGKRAVVARPVEAAADILE
jgi:arsenate reductase